MRIHYIISIFFALLFVVSGGKAFALQPFSRHVCAGYNNKDGACTASCKEGEIAICHDAAEANEPTCFCEAGNNDHSLNSYLRRLKAEIGKDPKNGMSFIGDVIFRADQDIYPEGQIVVPVAALCFSRSPSPMYCELKFADIFPLSQDSK